MITNQKLTRPIKRRRINWPAIGTLTCLVFTVAILGYVISLLFTRLDQAQRKIDQLIASQNVLSFVMDKSCADQIRNSMNEGVILRFEPLE